MKSQGYGSFLLRDLPFDAIQFCIYEQIRIGYMLAVNSSSSIFMCFRSIHFVFSIFVYLTQISCSNSCSLVIVLSQKIFPSKTVLSFSLMKFFVFYTLMYGFTAIMRSSVFVKLCRVVLYDSKGGREDGREEKGGEEDGWLRRK